MITRNRSSRFITPAVVALSCGAFALACSTSEGTPPGADSGTSTGGAAGSSGGTGGKSTGGSSAGGSGGQATDAGTDASGDASTDATTRVDGSADGAVAQEAGPGPADSLCHGPTDAAASGHVVLAAGSDFATKTEVATVDLGRACVIGRAVVADSDAVPVVSDGRPFVLERTSAALDVLSPSGTVVRRIDLGGPDGGTSPNPHDVVVVPGGSKAYVPMYGVNQIAIVDVSTGSRKGSVDLSSLMDAADTDGAVDADAGFYDPVTQRVFFTLQRIDVSTVKAPDYQLGCTGGKGLLIAVDPASDTLVDLNGGASGVGVELSLVSGSATPDLANRRVLLPSAGCFRPEDGGSVRVLHGVESVNLSTYTTSVLYAPTTQDFVSRLVLLGTDATALQTFDSSFTTLWNLWAPSSPTLGAALTGVPGSAVALEADTLVGLTFAGHPAVTRYVASTRAATVVVAFPWESDMPYGAGMALVR